MRIAICDDEKIERQAIIDALNSVIKNFSVNEFDDGRELIKSHSMLAYDLIITDIIMPKISGMDTIAQIRKTDTHTPVVFVSSSDEFGVMSYRVLAFDYLLKPINTVELKNCMKRLFMLGKKKEYVTVTYSGTETKILLSNIQYIDSIDGDTFRLIGGKAIKISRTYLQSAKKAYFDYVFGSEA